MRVRKQSQEKDFIFGHGLKDFYQNSPDAVGQVVQTRLLLWVGEWFIDITEGTPYMQSILGKQQLSTIDSVIRSRILETEGVTGLSSYTSSIDHDNRKLSISATIDTLYGATTLQVAL